MSLSIHITRTIVLAVFLWMPAAASAQHTETTKQPTSVERFESSLIQMTIEFWTPRLNRYKAEIDRMLSASDLVDVNELRARAALLVERRRTLERDQKERQGRREQRYAPLDTLTVNAVPMRVDTALAMSGYDDIDSEGSEAEIETEQAWENRKAEERKRNRLELETALAGAADTVRSGRQLQDMMDPDEYRIAVEERAVAEEADALQNISHWIARNYRPGMDELVGRAFTDIDEFFEATRVHMRDYVAGGGSRYPQGEGAGLEHVRDAIEPPADPGYEGGDNDDRAE